jgi:serine/threonine-protein kinase
LHQLSNSFQEALADRYVVERELGRGGMATVHLARDLRHDRLVAIKVLRPELGLALGGERFLREIRLTARLRHPHILPVFDSGAVGAELWYAMPYVDGGSLRSRMHREGQLPLDDAVVLSRQMLAALAYAHREGIVHRDIKPENVLLEADEAVVADFGIARALHEAGGDRLTETGLSLGTPGYMSPEQVTGESEIDGRADVYAVGCVLFEMLAGRPPFTGATAQAVIAQKLIGTPPSIRAARPELSAAMDGCLARALAVTPAKRFATAEEFAQALEAAARAEGMSATRPIADSFLGAGSRLGRRALLAGMALIAVVAVGALISRASTPAAPVSATRLAVLPFSVAAGPDLAYLGPGMVDLLSRNLDGAGEIRTLDAGRVLTALRKAEVGVKDAAQSLDVARALGAGQAVQGHVSAAGPRLRIHAEVVATSSDASPPLSRATVEGDSAELFSLVDRLAAELLAERPQGPGFRLLRTAAFTTRSLSALKAYLKAEQHFRAVRPDSAIAGFRAAVDSDTAFALAAYRLSVAALWGNRAAQIDPALDRALRLADRLPPRDRALVGALDAFRRGTPDTAERRYRSILSDYPDDLEASAELGLLLFNYQPLRGRPRVEGGQTFQRVVELDPRFFCPI